ncbi:hypothetical protein HA039_32155 [Streptomyces liangshanensis]|uniref:Uncharacterized protein n=2 Tax=Streptomyces liangshanensis TaxID=2717324 RepID=A0A6G9HAE9_9ACTN|nr:hypothetical protein HA039_32155 [Streptomyces liangshanensis]
MIVKFLHDKGLRSDHAYTVACLTIGLSVASWAASLKVEPAGIARADRVGTWVGTWPATWFGLGLALAQHEQKESEEVSESTFG